MIAPGDTQALPRIPVPAAAAAAGLPTVALTLAPAALAPRFAAEVVPEPQPELAAEPKLELVAEVPPVTQPVEAPGDVPSHERIYEEAMATIAALASNWSSVVQRTTGRHRAAA